MPSLEFAPAASRAAATQSCPTPAQRVVSACSNRPRTAHSGRPVRHTSAARVATPTRTPCCSKESQGRFFFLYPRAVGKSEAERLPTQRGQLQAHPLPDLGRCRISKSPVSTARGQRAFVNYQRLGKSSSPNDSLVNRDTRMPESQKSGGKPAFIFRWRRNSRRSGRSSHTEGSSKPR